MENILVFATCKAFIEWLYVDGKSRIAPGVSSLFFMPMIDLKSSDEICIYSTLCFEQAKRYKCTPFPTFDQPLWWKSLEIQQY